MKLLQQARTRSSQPMAGSGKSFSWVDGSIDFWKCLTGLVWREMMQSYVSVGDFGREVGQDFFPFLGIQLTEN